jgi:hypothetical protein
MLVRNLRFRLVLPINHGFFRKAKCHFHRLCALLSLPVHLAAIFKFPVLLMKLLLLVKCVVLATSPPVFSQNNQAASLTNSPVMVSSNSMDPVQGEKRGDMLAASLQEGGASRSSKSSKRAEARSDENVPATAPWVWAGLIVVATIGLAWLAIKSMTRQR